MKNISILIAFLCIPFVLFAQTGILIGHITGPEGDPASHISVSLKGTAVGTNTNNEGKFIIKSKPGTYNLAVHGVGLQTQQMQVDIQANDTTILQHIKLGKRNHKLQEVIISDQRERYKINKVSNSLRLITPVLELPQNIQVISESALADQQVTAMGDGVIRNVSGATKLEHWGMYTRINMRGSRASEFRNGMNVTSNWGPLSVDMSLVDHIEFVKGPAGFMMSNGEPSGIFNVVTKKPTGRTGGEASLMFGSFGLYRATLDVGGHFDKNNKLQYRLNLMGQTQHSFQQFRFNKRYAIAPSITYIIDEKTDITAEYIFQHDKISNVGLPYAFSPKGYADLPRDFTLAGPGLEPTVIDDHSLFLYLHHHFNKNWKLTVQGAHLSYKQIGSSLWPASMDSTGDMIRTVSSFDALYQSDFGQVFVNGKFETGPVQHKILTGLDLGVKDHWYDWNQSHNLDDTKNPFNIYHPQYGHPSNEYPDFDRSESIRQRAEKNNLMLNQNYSGLYLQDQLGFWENKIRLTLAGRYTYVKQSNYGTDLEAKKFTPRVGLSVSIDKNTSAYALFDQSFLPQSGLLRGNKLPDPQTGNNLEIGFKKDWMNGKWNTTLAVYRILKNGLLVNDPDTTNNPNNRYSLQIGQSKTQGVELDVRGQITKGLNVILNYAYTDSKISKDSDPKKVGNPVPGFAKHVANGWLTYDFQNGFLEGFGLSGGFAYQADRSTWGWASENQMSLPDYFRLDGGIFWKKDKLKVILNVNNLLDTYLYSGAPYGSFYYWQAEAPRNFRLSVAYRF